MSTVSSVPLVHDRRYDCDFYIDFLNHSDGYFNNLQQCYSIIRGTPWFLFWFGVFFLSILANILLNSQNSQQKAWKKSVTQIPSSLIHEICRGNFFFCLLHKFKSRWWLCSTTTGWHLILLYKIPIELMTLLVCFGSSSKIQTKIFIPRGRHWQGKKSSIPPRFSQDSNPASSYLSFKCQLSFRWQLSFRHQKGNMEHMIRIIY